MSLRLLPLVLCGSDQMATDAAWLKCIKTLDLAIVGDQRRDPPRPPLADLIPQEMDELAMLIKGRN